MRKNSRRCLSSTLTVWVTVWVVGQMIAKRLSRGDEDSDEFQIVSICGGKEFQSHAEHLRTGSIVASMGGIDLDLRAATLDPAGASLDVNATMGGVQVTVPQAWAVDVDKSVLAGGFEAKLTPPEELPDDAPTLHIRAVVCMGGVLVTSDADR